MAHIWRKEYTDRSRILDKFYTKQEVVRKCLDEVHKLPYTYDCVIENLLRGTVLFIRILSMILK